MAVAKVDNGFDVGTPAATITNSAVISASATALVVTVHLGTNSTSGTLSTVSGVTWNGVSMSLLGNISQSDGLANSYVFGIANMTTGTHNVVISCSGGTFANEGYYSEVCSWSGTDLTTANCFPSANVLTDATTPTGTVYPTTAFSVTTASGDAAFAAMNCNNAQFTTMATGTLLDTNGSAQGNMTAGFKLAVGATTTLQFGSGTASNPACAVAIRIQQPQAGATLLAQIML